MYLDLAHNLATRVFTTYHNNDRSNTTSIVITNFICSFLPSYIMSSLGSSTSVMKAKVIHKSVFARV